MVGPKNPPLDPNPLITAKGAAASRPLNRCFGKHQKEGRKIPLPKGMNVRKAN
jgi:hypothetical protein